MNDTLNDIPKEFLQEDVSENDIYINSVKSNDTIWLIIVFLIALDIL